MKYTLYFEIFSSLFLYSVIYLCVERNVFFFSSLPFSHCILFSILLYHACPFQGSTVTCILVTRGRQMQRHKERFSTARGSLAIRYQIIWRMLCCCCCREVFDLRIEWGRCWRDQPTPLTHHSTQRMRLISSDCCLTDLFMQQLMIKFII